MIYTGDKIKRKDNRTFSNGEKILTVSHLETRIDHTKVWLLETKSWLNSNDVEKVSDNVNGIIELNGVKYQVENIPGKGECLVPVKRTPKTGEVWKGPKGGIYIVTAFSVHEGYELLGNMVYTIPASAEFLANNLSEAIQKGLIK